MILDYVVTTEAGFKKSWVIQPGATPQSIEDSLLLIKNESSALWIKRLLPDNVDQLVNWDSIQITPSQNANKTLFLFVLQVTVVMSRTVMSASPEILCIGCSMTCVLSFFRINDLKYTLLCIDYQDKSTFSIVQSL